MLMPQELREMKALTERVAHGSVTREDWSNLAVLALIYHTGDETIAIIAASGLDEFIRVTQPVYEGHAFQHDDYRRMYDRICYVAARYHRDLITH